MPSPRVSILLPFRNAAGTLEETLSSIRAQTFQDFEVLAVNDHSEDGGGALIASLAECDPRFRLLQSPARGLVAALNFGLNQAHGGLIARMDADDRMHPRRLELQFHYLCAHPQIAVVGSRVRIFPEESLTDGLRSYLEWQNGLISAEAIARDIYLEAPLAHPSVMFRKAAIRAAGGYRDGPFPEDYDLWLRLHAAGAVLAKLPQTLLDWRDTPGRASRLDPRYSRDAFDRLRCRYLADDPRLVRNRERLAIWGAGRGTRKRVRHLLERDYRPVAWIDVDPRKIGTRLGGVPVVDPQWLARADRPFVLSYVAVHGARACIECELDRLGYLKGEDYLNVG